MIPLEFFQDSVIRCGHGVPDSRTGCDETAIAPAHRAANAGSGSDARCPDRRETVARVRRGARRVHEARNTAGDAKTSEGTEAAVRTGFLYFAITKDWRFVKFGFTTNPQQRFYALRAGHGRMVHDGQVVSKSFPQLCPLGMIPAVWDDEGAFRDRFRDLLVNREEIHPECGGRLSDWLYATPKLLRHLRRRIKMEAV